LAFFRKTAGLIRHRVLRWRQRRARHAGQHDQAYALLMRELYTDFSRPMAEIHLDMAWERLAAGKAEEANALLRLAEDARLASAMRNEKRLLQCWALVEQGKPGDAETRLKGLGDDSLSPAQLTRKNELLVEACLARRDPEVARDRATGPALEAWRVVAEAEIELRQGNREAVPSRVERARALLRSRSDVPWLRRRMDRLTRDQK